MEPYADVWIQDLDSDKFPDAPEPQQHHVGFDHGWEISPHVAAEHLVSKMKHDDLLLARAAAATACIAKTLETRGQAFERQLLDVAEAMGVKVKGLKLDHDLSTYRCEIRVPFVTKFMHLSFMVPKADNHSPEEARLYRADGTHPLDKAVLGLPNGCRVPGCGRPLSKQFNVALSSPKGSAVDYVRGSCCDIPSHRTYAEAGYREENKALMAVFNPIVPGAPLPPSAGIMLKMNPAHPPGSALLFCNGHPIVRWTPAPVCEADVDTITARYPGVHTIEMNPMDLSTYTRSYYPAVRVVLPSSSVSGPGPGPVPANLTVDEVNEAFALSANIFNGAPPSKCECGASKIGVRNYSPGHSSWCPVK